MRRPLFALALLTLAMPADAQVRASERGATVQTIDGTTITIDYSRPVARGRTQLFGAVVHWGRPWTPGANWATTIEATKDIRLNGHVVPAGKYAIWMIPQEQGEWTVILDRNARRFHTQPPADASGEVARFTVTPEQGAHMETLSFYFPVIGGSEAMLRMHWGTTFVPISVSVPATRPAFLAADKAGPYLGTYSLRFLGGEGPPFPIPVDFVVEDGRLRGRFHQPPPDGDPVFDLIPIAEHRFHPVYYKDGQMSETDLETVVVFTVENGRATRFEWVFEGEAYAAGERSN